MLKNINVCYVIFNVFTLEKAKNVVSLHTLT